MVVDSPRTAKPVGTAQELIDQIRHDVAFLTPIVDPGWAQSKEGVRRAHLDRRITEQIRQAKALSTPRLERLKGAFATGHDLDPSAIRPRLVNANSTPDSKFLFRLATSLWSVPVSPGFGRRLRYLVIDGQNDQLIGVIALMDPVFNLSVRDRAIGWTAEVRKSRLSSLMDAYVLGAVPPYSRLLGGKLVASLLASSEIAGDFKTKYSEYTGIISGIKESKPLAAITVTSALGRSSIYNRVKLPGVLNLKRLGTTVGFGHFHVPEITFARMRALLQVEGHGYADGHQFGTGPNWRFRVIREAMRIAGVDGNLLKHGMHREVFMMPLAEDWQAFLLREQNDLQQTSLLSVRQIAEVALSRWVIPRASRIPDWRNWSRMDIDEMFRGIHEQIS